MMSGKTLPCTLLMIALCGCANLQTVSETRSESLGTHAIFEKNYQLGQELSANVGEPMVRIKEQYVERFIERPMTMQTTEDFVIRGGPVTLRGEKNTPYPIQGEITLGGHTYRLIDLPGGSQSTYRVLINKEGRVYYKVLFADKFVMWQFKTTPPELRFEFSQEKDIYDVVKSGRVFELIYGGTDGKTIYVTYREFADGELNQPVFFQHLIYKADSESVRFRNMEMKIHKATHDKVVFTLIRDDLNEKEEVGGQKHGSDRSGE